MTKSVTTIYLVRHGETEGNVAQKMQGHADFPLTQKGVEQIHELREKLQDIHFHAIYSSDLLRAKRTAEIIAMERHHEVHTSEKLREQAYGIYDGVDLEVYLQAQERAVGNFGTLSKEEKDSFSLGRGFESNKELMLRFIPYIQELSSTYIGKQILVVTHGSVMRNFLIRIGYATYDTIKPHSVKNASYIVLESDGIDFSVKELFNVCVEKD